MEELNFTDIYRIERERGCAPRVALENTMSLITMGISDAWDQDKRDRMVKELAAKIGVPVSV